MEKLGVEFFDSAIQYHAKGKENKSIGMKKNERMTVMFTAPEINEEIHSLRHCYIQP